MCRLKAARAAGRPQPEVTILPKWPFKDRNKNSKAQAVAQLLTSASSCCENVSGSSHYARGDGQRKTITIRALQSGQPIVGARGPPKRCSALPPRRVLYRRWWFPGIICLLSLASLTSGTAASTAKANQLLSGRNGNELELTSLHQVEPREQSSSGSRLIITAGARQIDNISEPSKPRRDRDRDRDRNRHGDRDWVPSSGGVGPAAAASASSRKPRPLTCQPGFEACQWCTGRKQAGDTRPLPRAVIVLANPDGTETIGLLCTSCSSCSWPEPLGVVGASTDKSRKAVEQAEGRQREAQPRAGFRESAERKPAVVSRAPSSSHSSFASNANNKTQSKEMPSNGSSDKNKSSNSNNNNKTNRNKNKANNNNENENNIYHHSYSEPANDDALAPLQLPPLPLQLPLTLPPPLAPTKRAYPAATNEIFSQHLRVLELSAASEAAALGLSSVWCVGRNEQHLGGAAHRSPLLPSLPLPGESTGEDENNNDNITAHKWRHQIRANLCAECCCCCGASNQFGPEISLDTTNTSHCVAGVACNELRIHRWQQWSEPFSRRRRRRRAATRGDRDAEPVSSSTTTSATKETKISSLSSSSLGEKVSSFRFCYALMDHGPWPHSSRTDHHHLHLHHHHRPGADAGSSLDTGRLQLIQLLQSELRESAWNAQLAADCAKVARQQRRRRMACRPGAAGLAKQDCVLVRAAIVVVGPDEARKRACYYYSHYYSYLHGIGGDEGAQNNLEPSTNRAGREPEQVVTSRRRRRRREAPARISSASLALSLDSRSQRQATNAITTTTTTTPATPAAAARDRQHRNQTALGPSSGWEQLVYYYYYYSYHYYYFSLCSFGPKQSAIIRRKESDSSYSSASKNRSSSRSGQQPASERAIEKRLGASGNKYSKYLRRIARATSAANASLTTTSDFKTESNASATFQSRLGQATEAREETATNRTTLLKPASIKQPLVRAQLQAQAQAQDQHHRAASLSTSSSSLSPSARQLQVAAPSSFAIFDDDRVNEQLVELLAEFYAHLRSVQEAYARAVRERFKIQATTEAPGGGGRDEQEQQRHRNEHQILEARPSSSSSSPFGNPSVVREGLQLELPPVIGDPNKNLATRPTQQSVELPNKTQAAEQQVAPLEDINSSIDNQPKSQPELIEQERQLAALRMHLGADQESLLRWLSQRQEFFPLMKNASFELIAERPNRSINVCPDGPKILVLPNVTDIIYCYTREQWIDKLWSDLRLSAFQYPIILLNILIFLVGTTGNIFVCLSVKRNHQLRSVTNYFIVNLAFADFLVILICLPATVVWDLSLTWFFDTIPCKLIMFLQDVSISVSVLTLTAISIDRYYAICHPLKFKTSLSQAKHIIVLIWLVSLAIMAPDLVYLSAKQSADLTEAGLDTVLYSDCNYNWSNDASRAFQFVKTVLLYLLPFILMFCAHYRILKVLRLASSMMSGCYEESAAGPLLSATGNGGGGGTPLGGPLVDTGGAGGGGGKHNNNNNHNNNGNGRGANCSNNHSVVTTSLPPPSTNIGDGPKLLLKPLGDSVATAAAAAPEVKLDQFVAHCQAASERDVRELGGCEGGGGKGGASQITSSSIAATGGPTMVKVSCGEPGSEQGPRMTATRVMNIVAPLGSDEVLARGDQHKQPHREACRHGRCRSCQQHRQPNHRRHYGHHHHHHGHHHGGHHHSQNHPQQQHQQQHRHHKQRHANNHNHDKNRQQPRTATTQDRVVAGIQPVSMTAASKPNGYYQQCHQCHYHTQPHHHQMGHPNRQASRQHRRSKCERCRARRATTTIAIGGKTADDARRVSSSSASSTSSMAAAPIHRADHHHWPPSPGCRSTQVDDSLPGSVVYQEPTSAAIPEAGCHDKETSATAAAVRPNENQNLKQQIQSIQLVVVAPSDKAKRAQNEIQQLGNLRQVRFSDDHHQDDWRSAAAMMANRQLGPRADEENWHERESGEEQTNVKSEETNVATNKTTGGVGTRSTRRHHLRLPSSFKLAIGTASLVKRSSCNQNAAQQGPGSGHHQGLGLDKLNSKDYLKKQKLIRGLLMERESSIDGLEQHQQLGSPAPLLPSIKTNWTTTSSCGGKRAKHQREKLQKEEEVIEEPGRLDHVAQPAIKSISCHYPDTAQTIMNGSGSGEDGAHKGERIELLAPPSSTPDSSSSSASSAATSNRSSASSSSSSSRSSSLRQKQQQQQQQPVVGSLPPPLEAIAREPRARTSHTSGVTCQANEYAVRLAAANAASRLAAKHRRLAPPSSSSAAADSQLGRSRSICASQTPARMPLPPPPSPLTGSGSLTVPIGGHCDANANHHSATAASPTPTSAFMLIMHNKSKLESRRKAAKMLTAIVVLFGICYLPVHLINFLRQFIDDIPQTDITSTISMLSHCVCYLNSAINPIIYNHMNSVFRAEFRKFLSCLDWRQHKQKQKQKQKQMQKQQMIIRN